MQWSDVGSLIKDAAPLVASALAPGVAVPLAVITHLTTAFGLRKDSTPEQVYNAVKTDVDAARKLADLQLACQREADRLDARVLVSQMSNVRHAMLKEYALDNKFKSYWRPSFGYMMVFLIAVLVLWLISLGSFVFFISPTKLPLLESVITVILTPIVTLLSWCVGILGINIYHRSKDKGALLSTESLTDLFKRTL